MANPSFSISDEELERLDEVIFRLKVEGEIDRNASRSQVLVCIVNSFISEHEHLLEDDSSRM